MKKYPSVFTTALLLLWGHTVPAQQPFEPGRWTSKRAQSWYDSQPWLIGANFVPSTAINQLEMWQAETFDPATIDKELAKAEWLGMRTARVFLHDLVWKKDAAGFKQRLDRFLAICHK